jgi:hypothetical protein
MILLLYGLQWLLIISLILDTYWKGFAITGHSWMIVSLVLLISDNFKTWLLYKK